MKLNLHEIAEESKELLFAEPTAALTGRLVHGDVCDFEFPDTVDVRLEYYRSGQELFFRGQMQGIVTGHCSRCLENYDCPLDVDFDFVLVPQEPGHETEATEDDLDLGHYHGEEIDIGPLLEERLILALPTRPLCRESCQGLCPGCGANRNLGPCLCPSSAGDPRLAVLQNLKAKH